MILSFIKNNKKNIIIYLICLTVSIIVFIPFLTGHYAGDTYNIEGLGYEEYAITYNLKDGRLFMCLFNLLVAKLNLRISFYVFITLFLALVVSNIAVLVLKNIIDKVKEPKSILEDIFATIISYVTIFNFMYMDCLNFAEAFIISLSILLFLLSANILVSRQKNSFLKSTILAIIAIWCYQATVSVFALFVVVISLINNLKNKKQFFKDLLKCFAVSSIAIFFSFILIKCVGFIFQLSQSRSQIDFGIIKRNVIYILKNMHKVINTTCNIFPKYLFVFGLLIISALILIYTYLNKKRWSFLVNVIILMFFSILMAFILNILSISSFYGARTHLPIGMCIGVTYIYLYIESDIFSKTKGLNILFRVFLILYMFFTLFHYNKLMLLQKQLNILEKRELQEIEQYVDIYEEINDIKITNIKKVVFIGQSQKQYYNSLPKIQFLSGIVRSSEFADKAINTQMKRELEAKLFISTSETVEEYTKILENEKGYECIGDTLYISVYSY